LQRFFQDAPSQGAGNNRNNQKLGGLEDLDDGTYFDQFKGKKSTYDENMYTTKIDNAKITPDL
jgi:PAB1-binding protein PBP1